MSWLCLAPCADTCPCAQFVEDVAAYLKDKNADAVIKTLQDAYARLQMQEVRAR